MSATITHRVPIVRTGIKEIDGICGILKSLNCDLCDLNDFCEFDCCDG